MKDARQSPAHWRLRSPLLCVSVLTPKVTKEDWSSLHGSARNDSNVNLMRRTIYQEGKDSAGRGGCAHVTAFGRRSDF